MPPLSAPDTNPDVRPAAPWERSGIATLIALVGGALVEKAVAALSGVEAWWAPYVAAAVTALWKVFRSKSYRPDELPPL